MNLEEKIIHLMVVYPEVIDECPLIPEDFQQYGHEFETIVSKKKQGCAISLGSEFGFSMLPFLEEDAVYISPAFFQDFCRTLREQKILREIKKSDSFEEISMLLGKQFFTQKPSGIKEMTSDFYDKYAEKLEKKEQGYFGIKTGFPFIDQDIIIDETHIVTIAARTNVGKSAFAFTLAKNIAKNGLKVLYLSLEMSEYEMMERLIASSQSVELRKIRKCEVKDMGQLLDEVQKGFQNLFILAPEAITTPEILYLAKNFDCVFVDQLSNIRDDNGERGETLVRKYERIYNELRVIANGGIPVFICHQINREGVDVPSLHHLKDSGAVEEKSNIVFILEAPKEKPSTLNVYCAKNRQGGKLGRAFRFDKDFVSITEEPGLSTYDVQSIF